MPIGNSVVIEGQTANIISPTWPVATGSGAVMASGGPLFAVIIKAPLAGSSGIFIGGTSPNLANAGGSINANNGAGLFLTPDDNITLKVNNFNKISVATFAANSGTAVPIIGLQSP